LKKLLFGITSLTIGGAERVLVDLANELFEKYEITIFTIYPNGEFEKSLFPKIKLKSLYNKQYKELNKIEKVMIPLRVWLQQKSIYKKHIKDDYDVEIAFLEGAITRLFSTKNVETTKIAWIHNDISKVFGKSIKSKIKRNVDKKIYSKYDKLIFVSNDNIKKFEEVYKNNKIQTQKIAQATIEKAEFAASDMNKQMNEFVDKLNSVAGKLAAEMAKDEADRNQTNIKGWEDDIKYLKSQMRSLNKDVVFEGNVASNYEITLDLADFKKNMEDAIKRSASKEEINSIIGDQVKKWGTEGNEGVVKAVKQALEEIKSEIGK